MLRPHLLLAGALALCACSAPYHEDLVPGRYAPTPGPPPVLDVHNDHWSPMRLFLVRPGLRYFLGELEPGGRGTFRLPGELLRAGPVQVLAAARGAAVDHLTEPLRFDDGHRLELRLRKHLYSSRLRVR